MDEVKLQGFKVPDDGFIIICKNKITHRIAYDEWNSYKAICDIENPDVVSNGYSPVAIIEGDLADLRFVDMYGYPKETLRDTKFEFNEGRAVRRFHSHYSFGHFRPSSWQVNPHEKDLALVTDMDPREWVEIPLKLIFTEFCDPSDDPNNRFIELYSPNKRDYVIRENLVLLKFEGTLYTPSADFESLRGKRINEDGFLVLCTSATYWGEEKCDVVLGSFGISNSDGHNHFVLAECHSNDLSNCDFIDVYGRPMQDIDGTDQDFKNGMAVRRKGPNVKATPIFDINQWYVLPGKENGIVTSSQCEPGTWLDIDLLAPRPSPTSAPVPVDKKNKSKSNSSKNYLR